MAQVRAWAIASTMLATSASTNAAASGFQQLAAPQLKRAAQQAQQAANTLQTQARDAWKRVDSAKVTAHAIDARANQAVSSADKARKNMLTLGEGVLAANRPISIANTSASTLPPTTYSPSAQAANPAAAPAVLNNLGQHIGALLNIAA